MLTAISFAQSSILISAINDKAAVAYSIAAIALEANASNSTLTAKPPCSSVTLATSGILAKPNCRNLQPATS